ncbi:hypothetical protein [Streptacidiphilus sp. EB103A]|uniref:hypothetical protein n=1 Tax=Streptacidiphilus sp. EB103A TaxID=3156275 RepID=UPI003512835D
MVPSSGRAPGRFVVALAAVVLGLAGCARGTTGTGTPAAAPPAATSAVAAAPSVVFRGGGAELLSDGSMVLPLDAYDGYDGTGNEELIYRAATAVEQRCMRARGLDLPNGYGGRFLPVNPPSLVYYGVADMADAKAFGYRMPEAAKATGTATPSSVPANVLAAFYGTGGCAHQAYDALQMSQADAAFGLVQQLRSRALTEVYSDARVTSADTRWSACMAAAGYRYTDPLAPGHDRSLLGRGLPVPAGAQLAPPSPAEKAAAETDVTCKQKTRYLQIFAEVTASHQQHLIDVDATQLQRARAQWSNVLRAARAAVSTGR